MTDSAFRWETVGLNLIRKIDDHELPKPSEMYVGAGGLDIEGYRGHYRRHGYGPAYWLLRGFRPGSVYPQGSLLFTPWAFGGCSASMLENFTVYDRQDDASLLDFLLNLRTLMGKGGYNSHRIFCNLTDGSIQMRFTKQFLDVFGTPDPIYTFVNRAHSSYENQLFDLNWDLADKKILELQNVLKTGSEPLPPIGGSDEFLDVDDDDEDDEWYEGN